MISAEITMTSNNSDQMEVLPSISMETLRAELKEWERIFAEANNGRKAEREDIKRDLDIGMYAYQQPG